MFQFFRVLVQLKERMIAQEIQLTYERFQRTYVKQMFQILIVYKAYNQQSEN